MLTQLLFTVVTAMLSSLATLGLAALWYERRGQAQLDAALGKAQAEFEARVKSGVKAAGEELLPAFRQAVADGFSDALRAAPGMGLASDTAKVMGDAAGKTAGFIGEGLSSLLGLKKGK